MFGAVGDGVTDDTAAIQAAVDSPDNGGGIVAFEVGKTYRITDTITVNVARVRGIEGNNARLVTASDIVCCRIQGSHTGSASPGHDSSQRIKLPEMNPYVRDLRVHSDPELRGTALQVEGTFGLRVSGCQLFDLRTGIEFLGTNRNAILSDNHIWHCLDYGIWWNAGDIHQTNVVGNHVSYCRKILFLDGAGIYNVQVVGNALEASSSPEVVEHVVHAVAKDGYLEGFEFIGNSLEDHLSAAGAAVRIEGGPNRDGKQVMIIGNDLGNSSQNDIHISDMNEVVIEGNAASYSADYSIKLTGKLTAVNITGNVMRGGLGRPMGALMVGADDTETDISGLIVADNIADSMLRRPVIVRDASLASARVSGNVLHYSGDDDGALLEVSTNIGAMRGAHITGNSIRGNSDNRAISVHAAEVGLLIVKDNVADGIGPGAYELPEPRDGDVVIKDNLSG